MHVGGGERRPRGGMCGQPHRRGHPPGVDDDGRTIARQQAEAEHLRGRTCRFDVVEHRVHQHAERRDHEIDARARFLDEEQVLPREIAFARLEREVRPRRDADQPRCRTQDPQQVVGTGVGVVPLQAPGGHCRRADRH